VVGLGMNEAELRANERLDAYVVQDLNREARLPFADREFDGAGLCVSIQYLTGPEAVLREAGRVLTPGAPLLITFSNRCFPTKAVAIWQALDSAGHARLVEGYLRGAGGWEGIETLDRSPRSGAGARTGDPLYAVVARRAAPAPQE
jgi:ubiquinone/menaquinone biosynthesis C-methylase UbiE